MILIFLSSSCTSTRDSSWDPIINGTIAYPFAKSTAPIGVNGEGDKFVVKSAVGNTEYTVEIPQGGKDYDIEIPIAEMDSSLHSKSSIASIKPQIADNELVKNMPKPDSEDSRLVEGSFGVGHVDGPTQSPSYTIGISKINDLYLKKKYELALIHIDNLLSFYPTSAKLFKMKGTILLKLRNYHLAEIAWSRAYELEPKNKILYKALVKLRTKIKSTQLSTAH